MEVVEGYHVAKSVNRSLYTGDTIFVGGAGRFFEVSPEEMCNAMAFARDKLPGDTKMFCGHEYTVANLTYCKLVEPENAAASAMLEKA